MSFVGVEDPESDELADMPMVGWRLDIRPVDVRWNMTGGVEEEEVASSASVSESGCTLILIDDAEAA